MGSIICATRGGPGSRACQLRAIELAVESGSRLVFLHVVDPNAIRGVDERLRQALVEELEWVGRSLLNVALDRAEEAGVEAELKLLRGNTPDEIVRAAVEMEAEVVMLGRCERLGAGPNPQLEKLVARLEAEGIGIDRVGPESAPGSEVA